MADMQGPPLVDPYGGRGSLILGVTWAEAAVAIVLMVMRTYTNAFILKLFKWDYFWAMVTVVFGMIGQSMITVSVSSGLGNHIHLLTGPQISKAVFWSWLAQSFAIFAIGFGKIAVIAFILRIQDRANNRTAAFLTYFLYLIAVSNVIMNIVQVALIWTQCAPAAKLWNRLLPGTCGGVLRTTHVGFFQGSWAAISDVALAIYPVLMFWNLKISTKVKIGLCLLMGGGLVAAAAGVGKTISIKLLTVEQDPTYAISTLVIWAMTETWLVLALGSLPPLHTLFVRVFERISSTAARSHKSTKGYHPQNNTKDIPMYPSANRTHNDGKAAESERNILPGGAGTGILRTTRVQISSNPVGSSDGSNVSLAGRGAAF